MNRPAPIQVTDFREELELALDVSYVDSESLRSCFLDPVGALSVGGDSLPLRRSRKSSALHLFLAREGMDEGHHERVVLDRSTDGHLQGRFVEKHFVETAEGRKKHERLSTVNMDVSETVLFLRSQRWRIDSCLFKRKHTLYYKSSWRLKIRLDNMLPIDPSDASRRGTTFENLEFESSTSVDLAAWARGFFRAYGLEGFPPRIRLRKADRARLFRPAWPPSSAEAMIDFFCVASTEGDLRVQSGK